MTGTWAEPQTCPTALTLQPQQEGLAAAPQHQVICRGSEGLQGTEPAVGQTPRCVPKTTQQQR